MFFLLFFITSSHLTKSEWGRGTAHTPLGQLGERSTSDQILLLLFSKGKWVTSAAVIISLPFKTGNQSRVSNLPALRYQTDSLARSL